MNEYRNLAKNTFLFSIGTLGSTVISFLLVMIYTRYLTPSEYGIIDLVQTTISLMVPIITLQITDAVFRFAMEDNTDKKRLLSTALYFVFIVFFLFSLVSIYLATRYIPKEIIPLFYGLVLANSIIGVQTGFAKGQKNIKALVIAEILASIFLALIVVIFLVKLQMGVIGYLLAILSSGIFKSLVLWIKGRMSNYLVQSFDKRLLKQMLKYSIFLMPNVIMWWIVNVSDRYLLAYFLGIEAVGIYAISYKIPQLLRIPTMIFYQAWQISAVEAYKSENKDKFYSNILGVYIALLMLALSVLISVLKPLISVLFSSSFYESWKYAPFLLYGSIFSALSSFSGVAYIASKESKGALLTSSVAAIVNAIVNIILIPIWGIYAAAFSTFLAYFTMWAARMIHIRKFVNLQLNLRKFILAFAITLFQSGTLYIQLSFLGYFVVHATSMLFIILIFRHEAESLIKTGKDLSKEISKILWQAVQKR